MGRGHDRHVDAETFHRWLTIVQIGRVLIQMLAVKADAAALAQVAAWRKERYLTAGMVNRPSLLEYRAGRSVAPDLVSFPGRRACRADVRASLIRGRYDCLTACQCRRFQIWMPCLSTS